MKTLASPAVYPCIMGATATGKSDLALALVQKYNYEIISVDSMQVYKGMDIGTAKPKASILKAHEHHLVDITEADRPYNVQQFFNDALNAVMHIKAKGKIPLFVGGTMMYLNTLTHGLSIMPGKSESLRFSVNQIAQERGWPYLHRMLERRDEATASKIKPNDKQRITRALEIMDTTGQRVSEHFVAARRQKPPFRLLPILTYCERSLLHERINQRFDDMMQAGFVDEVAQFHKERARYVQMPAIRSVGYWQIWQYLDGMYNQKTAIEKAQAATRQLAKRQCTWQKQWKNVFYVNIENKKEQNLAAIAQHLSSNALVGHNELTKN